MNILLVEDNPASRYGLSAFLSHLGHKVTECENGRFAAGELAHHKYNMILSDVNMPKMNGFELLKLVKSTPAYKNIAVVLFTGFGDILTHDEVIGNGACEYLLKPINIDRLAEIIQLVEKKSKNGIDNVEK